MDRTGQRSFSWFEYTDQFGESYESERLRARCCYYANRLSYQDVAKLLKDEPGSGLMSSQRIHAVVEEEAQRLSAVQAVQAKATLASGKAFPLINPTVASYDAQCEEVLVFDDGIQVRKQKETRDKPMERDRQEAAYQGQSVQEPPSREKVTTDVIMVQQAQGGFTYMTEGLDGEEGAGDHLSAEDLVKSAIIKEYGEQTAPLNIVAITDGVRNIRLFLERVFGVVITIILDWYHLEKKVWELMSMIAWNKAEKEVHCRYLLNCLWEESTAQAIASLKTQVSPRNAKKHAEFITYLEKHTPEIINYHRRKEAGKPIGSGRMEKGVDRVIGQRQKHKGMSWSVVGSKALGILKIHELNEQIEEPGLLLAA